MPWGKSSILVLDGRADVAGRFELPSLPINGVLLHGSVDIEARAPGHPDVSLTADVDELRRGLVVELDPGFTVRGHFLEAVSAPAGGVPPTDVRVLAMNTNFSTGCDREGRFALALPRRSVRLWALVSPRGSGTPLARSIGTFDGAAGDVDLGDLAPSRGGPLVGQVVGSDGNAVEDGGAWLYCGGWCLASVGLDHNGRFEFPQVGDEPCDLVVRDKQCDDSYTAARTTTIHDVRVGGPDVRVTLTSASTIVMRFYEDDSRVRVASPHVEVRAALHGESDECVRRGWRSDAINAVRLDVPHAGSYDVSIVVDGYEPQRFSAVEVFTDREISLDLLLRKKRD
jgi:hypothetical protein